MLASAPALGCPDARPWVRIDATPDVTRLLRAELAPKHIDLCDAPAPGAPAPIASLTVALASDTATVRVEVRDRVTAKDVTRDVSLADVPEDTRALTIALAADELLRASWVELSLANAPPSPRAAASRG